MHVANSLFPNIESSETESRYRTILTVLDDHQAGKVPFSEVMAIDEEELTAAREWRRRCIHAASDAALTDDNSEQSAEFA